MRCIYPIGSFLDKLCCSEEQWLMAPIIAQHDRLIIAGKLNSYIHLWVETTSESLEFSPINCGGANKWPLALLAVTRQGWFLYRALTMWQAPFLIHSYSTSLESCKKLLMANTIIRHTSQLKNLPYSELSNSPKVTWWVGDMAWLSLKHKLSVFKVLKLLFAFDLLVTAHDVSKQQVFLSIGLATL